MHERAFFHRDAVAAGQGVNRAYMSPMRRGGSTTINMQAPDETLAGKVRRKFMEGINGGNTFVTENHYGGWSGSLRDRERIREDLDRF